MYKRLGEQTLELSNPQRSDTFIRLFRDEVRLGNIQAAFLPGERFELPKEYVRRGTNQTYRKDSREMLFEYDDDFQAWFDRVNRELAVSRKGAQVKVTPETIEAGLVDFEQLVEQTRAKMMASYTKGQALGKSRSKKAPKRRAGKASAAAGK